MSAPPRALEVSARTGLLEAPDSALAGWTRLRVREDGAGHIVVVFRLPDDATDSTVAAFLRAFDTARSTPAPVIAMGGPEIGDSGEVVLQLAPGRYLLGCMTKGEDGHRHASSGEARLLTISGSVTSEPPPNLADSATRVGLTEFAFTTSDGWKAGARMLRVENTGQQDHQLRLERFKPGMDLQQWLNADDPDQLVIPIAGVARIGPGMVAYLPVDLEPGSYLLYCLIPDSATGALHVGMGMMRTVEVVR
ncbi:MAG TPA: hypothetical protein VJU15_11335 [Gemmatimonadales bacterium]|nr:hypothetical protein [Gemmatimonadales bacterium]